MMVFSGKKFIFLIVLTLASCFFVVLLHISSFISGYNYCAQAAGDYNIQEFSLNTAPQQYVYSSQSIEYSTYLEYQGIPFEDYSVFYDSDNYTLTTSPPINADVYNVTILINESEIEWNSTLTISPKPIIIEYAGASTYQYFGIEFSRNISAIGVIDNEDLDLAYQYVGLKNVMPENTKPYLADSYEIIIFIGNDNYVINEYTGNNPGELVISKASLTAKAEDLTVNAGEIPDFSVSIIGFVNGESSEDLISIPTVVCEDDDPGTYVITPSGGAADNYTIQYIEGLFTINKLAVVSTTDDGLHEVSISGIFHPDFLLVISSLQSTDENYVEAMDTIALRNMDTYMDNPLYCFDTTLSEGLSSSNRYKIKITDITLNRIFSHKILVVDEAGLVHEITKYNYSNGDISFSSDVLGTIFIVERQLRTYLALGILGGLTLAIIAFVILTKLKYQIEKREIEKANEELRVQKNKYRWD